MSRNDLERLLELARRYNEPPPTPREEMWSTIRTALDASAEAERSAEGGLDLQHRRAARDRRRRLRRWAPWSLGIAAAATLAVGFGLGRITERPAPEPVGGPVAASEVESSEADEVSLPVRLAAADHMGQAEAMLTLYRSSQVTEDRAATGRWARELLTTTRLLMDSRAGRDPELASLLMDLELVLVQIVGAGTGETERALIEQGMEQRQLLPKLRVAAQPLETAL